MLISSPDITAQVTGADDQTKLREFEDAITKGEQFLTAKDYAKAKAEYQKALTIDPTSKYPKDKLEYIRKFYVDPADETRFSEAMGKGNSFMTAADYASARAQYEIAVNIKPEDKTAREKLAEADKLNLSKQESLKKYQKLITDADKLYAAKDFSNARAAYEAASAADPSAMLPRQKIAEIDAKSASDKAVKESYEKALAEGDEAYMNRDFATAGLKYELALKIKPGENYPLSMLDRVKQGSAQLKDAQQSYQTAIAGADKLFNAKDYETALIAYRNASKILPSELYPQQQIEKIEGIIQTRQKLEDDYQKIISAGNQFFGDKQYAEAKTEFQKANDLKPNENYPKQKIDEIAVILLSLKEAERTKAYQQTVTDADLQFEAKDYDKALIKYQEAREIKPDEAYPNNRIATINQIITEEKKAKETYDKTIAEADSKFKEGAFSEAIGFYQQALALNSNEIYPAQQITKANEAIKANNIREESYNQAIATGDNLLIAGNQEGAITAFQQALQLKPDASYPQEQISKINSAIAASRSKDEQYHKLITEADENYNSGLLQKSVDLYSEALIIKPNEKYAQDQVTKINAQISEQKAIQSTYNQQIAAADKLFDEADYEKARTKYAEATQTLPTEKYPAERITVINNIIEQQKSLEENYRKNIREGDDAYKDNNLESAIKSYEQAKALKPAEKYPQDQMALINKTLGIQKALNNNYLLLIADADRLFNAGILDTAINQYKEALSLKPSEVYPGQQIERIKNLLNKQKELKDSYDRLIVEADGFFKQEAYDQALNKYVEAQSLQPAELYPGLQIAKINTIKTGISQAEESYREIINRADKLYNDTALDEAATAYNEALAVKPADQYPKNQLALIDQKKSELKLLSDNYRQTLAEADQMYNTNEFIKALDLYQKALSLKPGEIYPQERIDEINSKLQEQKMLAEQGYRDAIEEADRLFNQQDYISAIKSYETASTMQPEELYPKNKLIEINTILMERSRNQTEAYNKIIMQADLSYQQRVYDQAIDRYEEAKLAKPDEIYPENMIRKIRQYMEDHAMVELISAPLLITADTEKKFSFKPIEMRLRKNNYVILKARKTGDIEPKVYVNYGIGGQKSGGIVLRSIKSLETGDYMIRVSMQDPWYRLDNNWISIYSEGGDIEISKMQVSQGD